MSAKPLGKGFCGPIWKQINWAMVLPVNEQSSIPQPTTKRKVIDAKNGGDSPLLYTPRFGKTQERIRTHGRSHRFEQSCSRLSSTLNGKDTPEDSEPHSSPSGRTDEIC